MREPLGYGQRQQQQFDPVGTFLKLQQIKSLQQERSRATDIQRREGEAEITRIRDRSKESQEKIGKEASREVFGAETGFEPYTEPTMRRFREGKPVPYPLVKTGMLKPDLSEGANIIGRPMGREDVVEGMRKERGRYDIDVKKAEPTQGEGIEVTPATEDLGETTRYAEPAKQVTERLKIFPQAPAKIGEEITAQTVRSSEQLKLRGAREAYPYAQRETVAKAKGAEALARTYVTGERTAKAEAELKEEQVSNLPIDRAIKSLQTASAALDLNIKGQQAHYTGPEAQARIDADKQKQRYYDYQLKDLVATKAREDAFNREWPEAIQSGDPNRMLGALSKLGSSSAPHLLKDIGSRGQMVRGYHSESGKVLGRIVKNLTEIEKDKQPEAHQAVLEADVSEYNELQSSLTKLIDKPSVKVGSLYTVTKGEPAKFGTFEVPREFKQRMDRNQLDFTNPSDLSWYVSARASGVFHDKNAFIRAIELIGGEVGAPPEIIDIVRRQYLNKVKQLTAPTIRELP